MSDVTMMVVFLAVTLLTLSFMRRAMTPTSPGSSASTPTPAKPQAVSKDQMAQDIKATQTSQVADAVAILDDLGSTSPNYRHYCELVGTSMATSNIIAPYSKRKVAFYDIKCYRIDAAYGGGQEETLVAHEHSFDPFFFTDPSSDTPIYIDLESFGNNVILVNSTNHIEGPNSDFAQAFKNGKASSATGTGAAYACVGELASRAAHTLLQPVRTLLDALAPHTSLQPAYALAGGSAPGAQPAARAGGASAGDGSQGTRQHAATSPLGASPATRKVMFAGPGGPGSPGRPLGHGNGGHHQGGHHHPHPSSAPRPNIDINVGFGNQMPGHLGNFMGPSHQPYVMGGGYTTHRPHSSSTEDLILGMSLGALLGSLTTAQQQAAQGYTTQADTFRGYRLVENIVPLGSPIYCIGEIYRHGTDVYMSRSLAKSYPTSFFATKPESEVLSAIGSR